MQAVLSVKGGGLLLRASEKGQDIFSVNISATKMAKEKERLQILSCCNEMLRWKKGQKEETGIKSYKT